MSPESEQSDAFHAEAFAERLRGDAHQYFDDLAGVRDVRLLSLDSRPFAALYTYAIESGSRRHTVMIKVARHSVRTERHKRGSAGERPAPSRLEPQMQFEVESASLLRVQAHFSELADPRFGWVPVLATWPEHRAIVMEHVLQPSLLQRSIPGRRPSRWPAAGLERAFRHAGGWLRAYHAVPAPAGIETVHGQVDGWLAHVMLTMQFLQRSVGNIDTFAHVHRALAVAAERLRHSRLPVGLRHGDYAMRNVLVGPADRITVLDIMARWLAPVYEDVGSLLAGLRTTPAQLVSQGALVDARRVDRYEREFLAGYTEQSPIPWDAVRLFEVGALLDRWASKTASGRVGRLPRGTAARLINRAYRRRIETVVKELGI